MTFLLILAAMAAAPLVGPCGQAIADCGPFLPEERPAKVADHLLRFLTA